MAKINARQKGHAFERKVCQELRELLDTETIRTAREQSKALDDMKVDIWGMPMFNIQCKATEKLGSPHNTLNEMPDDEKYNVVFHKVNRKGTIVAMSKEDFYEIIQMLKTEGLI